MLGLEELKKLNNTFNTPHPPATKPLFKKRGDYIIKIRSKESDDTIGYVGPNGRVITNVNFVDGWDSTDEIIDAYNNLADFFTPLTLYIMLRKYCINGKKRI